MISWWLDLSTCSGIYGVVAFGILYCLAYNLVGYLVNLYSLRHLGKVQDLKGKHVMVTGGSSGIGKAVAVAVARRGAHVSILARNAQVWLPTQFFMFDFCRNNYLSA